MKTDFYAYLVIDSSGEIMGSGHTEWHAIESAAKNLQMQTWEIEALIKKSAEGYKGDEETLIPQNRKEWEETSGMTVEEYLGK